MALASKVEVLTVESSALQAFELDVGTNNTVDARDPGAPVFLGANSQSLHQFRIDGSTVTIGIVDTGIDLAHRDFREVTAPRATRIVRLWDQTDTGGPQPAGETFGTEWTAADIDCGNGAGPCGPAVAPRERDTDGHGTHVAGIAAGNGSASGAPGPPFPFEGMAPRSPLIIVKTNFSETGVIRGVSYVCQNAANPPAIVNLSLGGHTGPHDGSSSYERALSALADAGCVIVAAAGNEAARSEHADNAPGGVVNRPPVGPASQTTTFNVTGRQLRLGIWHDSGDLYTITVSGPGFGPLTVAPYAPAIPGPAAPGTGSVGPIGGVTLSVHNATPALQTGTATGIEIVLTTAMGSPNPPGGPWTFQLSRVRADGNGRWDAWISPSRAGSFAAGAAGDGQPTNTRRIGRPATANSLISVAAHVTKNTAGAAVQALGGIANFSNPGPTRDDRLKPELSAPGYRIESSLSANAGRCSGAAWTAKDCNAQLSGMPGDVCLTLMGGGTCVAVPARTDATHYLSQGTSQAAPHVTGCLALIGMQRALTAASARQYLIELSRVDSASIQQRTDGNNNGRYDLPPPLPAAPIDPLISAGHWNADFGYGKLNCALKGVAPDIGANGAFFSVAPNAMGRPDSGVRTDPNPAHVFVGDHFWNGLAIHRDVLRLNSGSNIDAFSFKIDPATSTTAAVQRDRVLRASGRRRHGARVYPPQAVAAPLPLQPLFRFSPRVAARG